MTIFDRDKHKWQEVLNRVEYAQEGKQDATINTTRMRYLGDRQIMLPKALDTGYKVVRLTDTSSEQLFSAINVPSSYVRSLATRAPKLETELVNEALNASAMPLYWRFSNDRLRAVLRERTPSTDNLAVVEAMNSVMKIGDCDFVIRSVSLDDERFYLKVLFDAEYRDQTGIVKGNYLKVGVVLRSSETHTGQISLKPFMYRWSCTNDAVVSGLSFSTSNFSLSRADLQEEIRAVVANARISADGVIENAMTAQSRAVPAPKRAIKGVLESMNQSSHLKGVVRAFTQEPMPTQYGVSQAFTRYAQSVSSLDLRDSFETMGGNLLKPSVWKAQRIVV